MKNYTKSRLTRINSVTQLIIAHREKIKQLRKLEQKYYVRKVISAHEMKLKELEKEHQELYALLFDKMVELTNEVEQKIAFIDLIGDYLKDAKKVKQ